MPGPRKDSLLQPNSLAMIDNEGNRIDIDALARALLPEPPEELPTKKYTMRTVTLLPWRDIAGFDKYPHAVDMWYDLVLVKETVKWVHKQTMTRELRSNEQPPKKKSGTKKPPASNDTGGLADDLD
jgi:hypothetical protein